MICFNLIQYVKPINAHKRLTVYCIIILYYIILYYIILYYIILYYIILHYITLHYTTLHYTTLHYTTLHCIVSYHIIYIISYNISYIISYHIILYYIFCWLFNTTRMSHPKTESAVRNPLTTPSPIWLLWADLHKTQHFVSNTTCRILLKNVQRKFQSPVLGHRRTDGRARSSYKFSFFF